MVIYFKAAQYVQLFESFELCVDRAVKFSVSIVPSVSIE